MQEAISLVVVSQKRAIDLERLLASLVFQTVQNFEIIVVANEPPMISPLLSTPVRFFEMVEANISKARNIGIQEAKAPIIVFCDDDAVPDPVWLERLVQPFYENETIGVTAGFVRGRNGISYQWRAVGFYQNGEDFDISLEPVERYKVFSQREDWFVKAVGTNSAYRRDALHKIGGFDEAFFYYLDDADVSKRIQEAGYDFALVPKAEIIHNYRPSRGRSEERVPQSLYNLGASTHLFLRKHHDDGIEQNLDRFSLDQEKRLYEFFGRGLILPKTIKKLMRDLRNGIIAGGKRNSLCPLKKIKTVNVIPLVKREVELNITRHRPERRDGSIATIYLRIFPTTLAARLKFTRRGYWQVNAGLFGRLNRKGRLVKIRTRKTYQNQLENWAKPRFRSDKG